MKGFAWREISARQWLVLAGATFGSVSYTHLTLPTKRIV